MSERHDMQKKFHVFIFLSLFVLLLEIFGSILTNSLALLSDAGHVIVDVLSMLLAYFAMRISSRRSTEKFTFGFYRAEILAAALNSTILIVIALYIFYEAYVRFLTPQPVSGLEMSIIAAVGLAANLWVALKMHAHEKQNINVRGAYLHVLGDTLSSAGVVAASMLIILTGNYTFDSAISVGISLFLVFSSARLIRECLHILMEAKPKHIKTKELVADIQSISGVKEVHDVHVWCLSSDVYALSAHVIISAKNLKDMNKILANINKMLRTKYCITHATIQSECEHCVEKKHKH